MTAALEIVSTRCSLSSSLYSHSIVLGGFIAPAFVFTATRVFGRMQSGR